MVLVSSKFPLQHPAQSSVCDYWGTFKFSMSQCASSHNSNPLIPISSYMVNTQDRNATYSMAPREAAHQNAVGKFWEFSVFNNSQPLKEAEHQGICKKHLPLCNNI